MTKVSEDIEVPNDMQTSAKPNEALHKEENKSKQANKKKNDAKNTTDMATKPVKKEEGYW